MKRAFMSELAIVRTLVPNIAGVGLFIFVILASSTHRMAMPV